MAYQHLVIGNEDITDHELGGDHSWAHHLPFLSITARAFSVRTIRWALCLALLTITSGSLIFLASAMMRWPWMESPTS